MDRVILRECELRLRNVDTLRATLSKRLRSLGERPKDEPWAETRSATTECLVEAEAILDELRAIIKEVEAIDIPDSELEGRFRRTTVSSHAKEGEVLMAQVVPAIKQMIEDEDARQLTSARPSSDPKSE